MVSFSFPGLPKSILYIILFFFFFETEVRLQMHVKSGHCNNHVHGTFPLLPINYEV